VQCVCTALSICVLIGVDNWDQPFCGVVKLEELILSAVMDLGLSVELHVSKPKHDYGVIEIGYNCSVRAPRGTPLRFRGVFPVLCRNLYFKVIETLNLQLPVTAFEC
jgi:hypothetical protein